MQPVILNSFFDFTFGVFFFIAAVVFLILYLITYSRIGRIANAVARNDRHPLAPDDLDVTKEIDAIALVVATVSDVEKMEAAVRTLTGIASEKCAWLAQRVDGKYFVENGEGKMWSYAEVYHRFFVKRLAAQKEAVGHILAEYADNPRTDL